jgi:hypothetical protein
MPSAGFGSVTTTCACTAAICWFGLTLSYYDLGGVLSGATAGRRMSAIGGKADIGSTLLNVVSDRKRRSAVYPT